MTKLKDCGSAQLEHMLANKIHTIKCLRERRDELLNDINDIMKELKKRGRLEFDTD